MKRFFSVKMRASRTVDGEPQHISGAEKIIQEEDTFRFATALLDRALHHAKGRPDFVNLKFERLDATRILRLPALPVRTLAADSPAEGLAKMTEILRDQMGISNAERIVAMLPQCGNMRGAAIVDVDSLARLEPDQRRGVRVTYMDDEESAEKGPSNAKNHFLEAIVLGTKVAYAPHLLGELCISDDPDYVTGYIASRGIGYCRITCLKDKGSPVGGRIFLFRGNAGDLRETIAFLEKQPVLVIGVPGAPSPSDRWRRLQEELERMEANGLRRQLLVQEEAAGPVACVEGRKLLMLTSNNYLGLAGDARLAEAARGAVGNWGTGSTGSRLLSGTQREHVALEAELAQFKGTEDAILFNSGYVANVAVISALCGREDIIFSDELNHASIIDGCRLARSRVVIYRHNDMGDLERNLREVRPNRGLVVSDAVFSMDGDMVDLPRLLALSRQYGLFSMIDEAHATGVVGPGGRGTAARFGLAEGPDITLGTLSKALGGEGGFVCGRRLLCDYLRNRARGFIFTTSMAPAAAAVARAALRVLRKSPELPQRLAANVQVFVETLRAHGIATATQSAIVPIPVGDERRAVRLAAKLRERGILLSAIRYPTVALGQARLRASIMATHSPKELRWAAQIIAEELCLDMARHDLPSLS